MDTPHYPLYGSTYIAYRVSPLYYGSSALLSDATLRFHARRMRNVLKGDTLRGVQVGLMPAETSIANLGVLENCAWDLIGDEAQWEESQRLEAQDDMSDDLAPGQKHVSPEAARGIHIQLQYSNITHTALLLRDPQNAKSPEGFTALPLLLLRMPQPIREIVIDYLNTTFDTRIAPLQLRSEFLISSFETLISHILDQDTPQSVPDTIKSLQIQLAFPSTIPFLKHIDITIAREDIYEFWRRGQAPSRDTPFTEALVLYLSTHLALEPAHIRSGISKVVCALFAVSADSKFKLFPPIQPSNASNDSNTALPPSATEQFMAHFYRRLVAEATAKIDFSAPITVLKLGRSGGRGASTKRAATRHTESKMKKRKAKERVEDDELADADDAHTVGSGQTPVRESVLADPARTSLGSFRHENAWI